MINKKSILSVSLCAALVFVSVHLFAEQEKSKPPVNTKVDVYSYSNNDLGISFNIPKKIKLFTNENPGNLKDKISPLRPIWLQSPDFTHEHINVVISLQYETQDKLAMLKDELDKNAAELMQKVPGYKKISLKWITIGKQKNKKAVEHLFFSRQYSEDIKQRQIYLAHKYNTIERGILFTCTTPVERFDAANQKFFDVILNSLEFL